MPPGAPIEPLIVGGVLMASLVVYALTAGADFGGGFWSMFAIGSRKRAQREAIARAVSPIWEANHVWMILAIVLLFVCFPKVYATLGIALHLPLTGVLVGILLRGSAFAFRSHDYGPTQGRWDALFAASSLITPILLGICVGTASSGGIRLLADGKVDMASLWAWMAPFPVAVGLLALAQFAFLAATYLTLEAKDHALQEDFRLRALLSGVAVGGIAAIVLPLARAGAPIVWEAFATRPWMILLGGIALIAALAGLFTRNYRIARLFAAAHVVLVILGWAFAQFPYLVVPDLTIYAAHAEPHLLRIVLIVLALGSPLLIGAFLWLYGIFEKIR